MSENTKQTGQQPKVWEADTSRPKPEEGFGFWVKCGDELGYAKRDKPGEEWLGSKLGELLHLPVAKVERGIFAGQEVAISRLRSITTTPLSSAGHTDPAVNSGLKRASGLIPFLLWIGSGDHGKESNFVATPHGEGNVCIEAIDFGYCFEWKPGGLKGVAILQQLVDNRDPAQVEAVLSAVEALSDECILECCAQSGIGRADEVAAQLISRKKSLRGWLASLLV
jgi:hypothetical protein